MKSLKKGEVITALFLFRDNYDKEVKAKLCQGKQKLKGSSGKPKKPEIQTYVPPQRSKRGKIVSGLFWCVSIP